MSKITIIKNEIPSLGKLALQCISCKAKEKKFRKNYINSCKPFNMIIVGMTACGKTKFLLDFLEREYKNCFEQIFLICPTFEWNVTWGNWKY